MNRGEGPLQPVHTITGAASPHSDDLDARIRRYLISMTVRVICVLLAIVVHARWGHWSWWVFAAGAVVLPYVAVVMANAADRRRGSGPAPVPSRAVPLEPSPEPLVVTVHPPEAASARRVHHDSPDSAAFPPPFEQFATDSATSSEQAKRASHEWPR